MVEEFICLSLGITSSSKEVSDNVLMCVTDYLFTNILIWS